MQSPPPLPVSREDTAPPPLPGEREANQEAESARQKTITTVAVFAGLCTPSAILAVATGHGDWDFRVFIVSLMTITWIGLIGLVKRRKPMVWAVYVTLAFLLMMIPVGTIFGIFGFNWMEKVRRIVR